MCRFSVLLMIVGMASISAFNCPKPLGRGSLVPCGRFSANPSVRSRQNFLAATDADEQEITDLNLEEMFEVFEAADNEVTNEEVGMAPTGNDIGDTKSLDNNGEQFKQIRVILYIAISLIPILFLLPFLSSNEFKPLDPELIQSMVDQQ